MDLHNKWALVTGAAHRVGKNIAINLSNSGCNIYLHYGKSTKAAEETANELRQNGSKVEIIQADLSDPEQIEKLFSKIHSLGNQLDICVNSAASFLKKQVKSVSVEDWDKVHNTNLRAPFLIAQKSAEIMMKNPGNTRGNIVFISDLSGEFPWEGFSVHGISKAGIIHLTKTLAYEFAPNIRVNGVIPGLILPPPNIEDTRWKGMIDNIPLKRSGNPNFVSDTILFLLKNDFLTGNLIYVDGGEHLVGNINHGRQNHE